MPAFNVHEIGTKIRETVQAVRNDKKLMIASASVGILAFLALLSLFLIPSKRTGLSSSLVRQVDMRSKTERLPDILTARSVSPGRKAPGEEKEKAVRGEEEKKGEREAEGGQLSQKGGSCREKATNHPISSARTEKNPENPVPEKTRNRAEGSSASFKRKGSNSVFRHEGSETEGPADPVKIARKVVQDTDVEDSTRQKLIRVEPLTGEEIYRLAQVREELRYRKEIEKELTEIAKAKLERAMLAVNAGEKKKPGKKMILDSTTVSPPVISTVDGANPVQPVKTETAKQIAPEKSHADAKFPVIRVLGVFPGKGKAIVEVDGEVKELLEKQNLGIPGLTLEEVSQNGVVIKLNDIERLYFL